MKSSNKNAGWIFGRIYFNREDKRVIVNRLHGGYTMNFGNKRAWVFNIIAAIIIVILIIVF